MQNKEIHTKFIAYGIWNDTIRPKFVLVSFWSIPQLSSIPFWDLVRAQYHVSFEKVRIWREKQACTLKMKLLILIRIIFQDFSLLLLQNLIYKQTFSKFFEASIWERLGKLLVIWKRIFLWRLSDILFNSHYLICYFKGYLRLAYSAGWCTD